MHIIDLPLSLLYSWSISEWQEKGQECTELNTLSVSFAPTDGYNDTVMASDMSENICYGFLGEFLLYQYKIFFLLAFSSCLECRDEAEDLAAFS